MPLPTRVSVLLIALLIGSGAYAQSNYTGASGSTTSASSTSSSTSARSSKPMSAQAATDKTIAAQVRIDDAIVVVGKMKSDPKVGELLGKAKGVVIVPHFTQAALVFGGRGGAGVLLVRQHGHWSDPAFYKLGGGTFGAQIGGTSGALAMLLMSDKAVEAFENQASTWSMTATAGLTARSYSRNTPESGTLSDVIVWTDMNGYFGGAAIGATKVSRDTSTNQVYYKNPDVTIQQILSGAITNPDAKLLVDVMPPELMPKK